MASCSSWLCSSSLRTSSSSRNRERIAARIAVWASSLDCRTKNRIATVNDATAKAPVSPTKSHANARGPRRLIPNRNADSGLVSDIAIEVAYQPNNAIVITSRSIEGTTDSQSSGPVAAHVPVRQRSSTTSRTLAFRLQTLVSSRLNAVQTPQRRNSSTQSTAIHGMRRSASTRPANVQVRTPVIRSGTNGKRAPCRMKTRRNSALTRSEY